VIVNYNKENGFTTFIKNAKKEIPQISEEASLFFNKLEKIKGGTSSWNSDRFIGFANGMEIADESLLTFLNDTKYAEKSLANYQFYLESTAKSTSKFATVAKTAKTALGSIASFGLNMLGSMAMSWAITEAISAIDNWIHRTEIAIEKGKEAQETIASIGDSYNNKKDTVDSVQDRYIELSKGVNNKTNANINLSTEEYSEFLSITNQLAETFPSLVTGYDAQGNALLSLSGNADTTSASLEKLLEQERQLADFKVSQNLQTAFDGVIAQTQQLQENLTQTKDTIEELENVKESLDLSTSSDLTDLGFKTDDKQYDYALDLFAGAYDDEAKNRLIKQQNAFLQAAKDAGLETSDNMWEEYSDDAYDNAGNLGQSWSGHIYNASKKQLEEFTKAYKGYIKESGLSVSEELTDAYSIKNQDEKEIQATWNSLVPSLITAMSVYDGYDSLNDNIKQAINTGIGDINPIEEWMDENGKWNTPDSIRAYLRENFLDPIENIKNTDVPGISNALDSLFNLDTSKYSVSDYQSKLEQLLPDIRTAFTKAYGEEGESEYQDFMIKFGFKIVDENGTPIDKTDSLINNIKDVAKTKGEDISSLDFDEMTVEQLVNLEAQVTDSAFGDSIAKAYREITYQAKQVIDEEKPLFSSLLTDASNEGLSKKVDTFQSNLSTIQSAIDSLKAGEEVNLTDLIQEFPDDIIGKTNDLEGALSNLKNKNFADVIRQIFSSIDPSQMSDAQEFISTLFNGADVSADDFRQIRSKVMDGLLSADGLNTIDRQGIMQSVGQLFEGIDYSSAVDFTTAINNNSDAVSRYQNKLSALTQAQQEYSKSGELSADTMKSLSDAGLKAEDMTGDLHNKFEELISSTSGDFKNWAQDIAGQLSSADASAWLAYCDQIVDGAQKVANATMEFGSTTVETPAFADYNTAKETENAGDRFLQLKSIMEETQKAYEEGLVGTDDFKMGAKLFSPNAMEDAENWAENYQKISRYFTDDVSGMKAFLNDMEAKGLAECSEETGNWTFQTQDLAAAADEMGLSFEAMVAIMGRLNDYGFTNDYFSSTEEGIEHLSDLYGELGDAETKLQELKDAQAKGDETVTDTVIDGQQAKVDELHARILATQDLLDQLSARDAQSYEEKASAAQDQAKRLVELYNGSDSSSVRAMIANDLHSLESEYGIKINWETGEISVVVDKALEEGQEQADENPIEAKTNLTGTKENESGTYTNSLEHFDPTPATLKINVDDSQVTSAKSEAETPIETKNTIVTEDSQAQSKRSELEQPITTENKIVSSADTSNSSSGDMTTKATLDTSEVDSYTPSDKKSVVKFTKDSTEVDSYTPQDKNATVKFIKDSTEIDSYTPSDKNDTVKFTKDSTEVDSYTPSDKSAVVKYNKDSSEPDSYKPDDKSARVNYTLGAVPYYNPSDITRTLTYNIRVNGNVPKAGSAQGTLVAHADGTAYNMLNLRAHASGTDVSLKHDENAVVNELGIIMLSINLFKCWKPLRALQTTTQV